MTNLPELFSGPITQEYAGLSFSAPQEDNPTQTCGSDCSGGGECDEVETCLAKEEEEQAEARGSHKVFVSALAGWNEPPAARL